MTKTVLSQLQAAEKEISPRVHGVKLRDKARSCEIYSVEPLLHRIEKSQLRWIGNVTKMFQERLTRQLLLVTPTRKRPRGRPRTMWRGYIFDLPWSCLAVKPAELRLA